MKKVVLSIAVVAAMFIGVNLTASSNKIADSNQNANVQALSMQRGYTACRMNGTLYCKGSYVYVITSPAEIW